MPAGLIDKNEDAKTAGERELYEETGYKGKTEEVSPVIVSDPGRLLVDLGRRGSLVANLKLNHRSGFVGMSSANMCISTVHVNLSEGDELQEPEQHLDEGEFVEKRIVYMKGMNGSFKISRKCR